MRGARPFSLVLDEIQALHARRVALRRGRLAMFDDPEALAAGIVRVVEVDGATLGVRLPQAPVSA